MSEHLPYECQDCGPVETLARTVSEVKDLHQRVEPGEPMPAGECSCGALAHVALTERQKQILELAHGLVGEEDILADYPPPHEGEENGAYVTVRTWVSFWHTDLNKECQDCNLPSENCICDED